MVLTKGDEYPVHQTPEPIAYSGTDRNFYDRYFFNGYEPDGGNFFAAAFGVYPQLGIVDGVIEAPRGAHFTECPPDYERDEAFQREYAATAKDADAWERFRSTYLEAPSHEAYLAAIDARGAGDEGGQA